MSMMSPASPPAHDQPAILQRLSRIEQDLQYSRLALDKLLAHREAHDNRLAKLEHTLLGVSEHAGLYAQTQRNTERIEQLEKRHIYYLGLAMGAAFLFTLVKDMLGILLRNP